MRDGRPPDEREQLIFFRDGEPLFQMTGLVPKPVLERELGELVDRR